MARTIEETRTFPAEEVPESIPQFLAWLVDIAGQLPPDAIAGATIEFNAEEVSCECIERSIEISWLRPETAQERHRRKYEKAAEKAARADGWSRSRPWSEVPDRYYPPFTEGE